MDKKLSKLELTIATNILKVVAIHCMKRGISNERAILIVEKVLEFMKNQEGGR